MQKHLPNIAMLVGALVAAVSLIYAMGRVGYLSMTGASVATVKLAAGQVTLFCLMVVPFSLLVFCGGWIWKRSNAEAEKGKAAARDLRKRQEKPGGKFAR